MSEESPIMSRRHFLWQTGGGLGAIALACLLQEEASGSRQQASGKKAKASPSQRLTPHTHFPPKAKRVIQVFCCGGVSHIDTFDYKPELEKRDGKPLTNKGRLDTFFGESGNLMRSPFTFRRRGQSGLWASDLLPHLAGCMDDMTFLHSMTSKNANHTPATFYMNSGFTMNGYPSLGAWLSFGLGTINQDLPAFVVLPDPRGLPAGGAINWTPGFLHAAHQGVVFGGEKEPLPNLFPPAGTDAAKRKASAAFLERMNRDYLRAHPGDSALDARIAAYALAARMQASVPEAVDFARESEATRRMYGLDNPATAGFGRNCLLARRLVERGVRFVQLYHGGAFGSPRINWDAHEDIVENHTQQAISMDQPVAALLQDLKQRGMLDDTLLLWTTEFGRAPITQGVGKRGRDHHQHGFTIWMAGAGLKPGFGYGSTDEVGYRAAPETALMVHDFHATVLHLLGLDHKKLTFYHNGIQRRLTDVHGHVIREVLA